MYYIIFYLILISITILFILYNEEYFKKFYYIEKFINFTKIKNNKDKILLTEVDHHSILKFVNNKFNYDNIFIPKDILVEKQKDLIKLKNITILCTKNEEKFKNNINLIFYLNKNSTFISEYNLFGINGYFSIENIQEEKQQTVKEQEIVEKNINNIDTDLIPDVINISTDNEIEEDSINISTDSEIKKLMESFNDA